MAEQKDRTPVTISVEDVDDLGALKGDTAGFRARSVSPALSAGDVDASWQEAESSGDETAGSSNPTPDQEDVDDIGRAIGMTYQEGEPLRVGGKEHDRDEHRWELDPASAEDYGDRSRESAEESEPIRKMTHGDQYKNAAG